MVTPPVNRIYHIISHAVKGTGFRIPRSVDLIRDTSLLSVMKMDSRKDYNRRTELWLFASALLGELPEATNRRVDKIT
ncbi:MAG: hypothetical protein AUJ60_07635 [Nitrospirae bacterium CG1_02_44_142]|nr:MAG: hypothetical protein AUJ60_07635 [Nitrospirae bacterium CG1_02_44_142]